MSRLGDVTRMWKTLDPQEWFRYRAKAAAAELAWKMELAGRITPEQRDIQINDHLKHMKIKVTRLEELGVEICFMAFDRQKAKVHAYGSKAAMAFLDSTHTTNAFALHFQVEHLHCREEPVEPEPSTSLAEMTSVDEQCVESRLQLTMNPLVSASDVSIEQEGISVKLEPAEHQHLNILHMTVGEEVSPEQERSPGLLQEEPEPPYIKEEQEELKEEQEPSYDISSHCTEVEVELDSDSEVTEDSDDLEESIEDDDDQQRDKSFTDSAPLDKHRTVSFDCRHCNKSFRRASTLEKHNLKAHLRFPSGEMPFHCKHCCKSFRRASSLEKHRCVQPFRCNHCGKSFHKALYLKSHISVHEREKPFQCDHCDASFNYAYNLKAHLSVHTGEMAFHCKHCSKDFSDVSSLMNHQYGQAGEKPFQCTHCDISCCHLAVLKTHQFVHTRHKPFHCIHCGESFSQLSELKSHRDTKRHQSLVSEQTRGKRHIFRKFPQ